MTTPLIDIVLTLANIFKNPSLYDTIPWNKLISINTKEKHKPNLQLQVGCG